MRKNREKGVTLLIGTLSMLFIIPMMGLAIDVGFIYAVKAKLQASVDGAALAAARALSIGLTMDAQRQSAQNNATNWFNANFPSAYFGTSNTAITYFSATTDPTYTQLQVIKLTATTTVNTFFMKWLGFQNTTVTASGNASRRAVVAMLVLDRSGSMCSLAGHSLPPSCLGTDTTYPCGNMVAAAKMFVGQFQEGSDYIGLVSFSHNAYVNSKPVSNFHSVLGYTNSQGSATGQLDAITCIGGTGTAAAMSMAYQLIEQTNLPGALNVIVLETDGLPNALTVNFWDATNKVAGIKSGSNCTDATGQTVPNGFKTLASLRNWTSGLNMQASPFLTTAGVYSSIPAGIVAEPYVATDNSGNPTEFWLMMDYLHNSDSYPYGNPQYLNTANGCDFNNRGPYRTTTSDDIAWFPATDVFGNQLKPSYGYQSVNPADAQGHIQFGVSNYYNAVFNATENSAYQARTNANIPITVYTIGLGGDGAPPDPVLLQRMANDPNPDLFNSPTTYVPCSQAANCATFSAQPQGTFVYSPDTSNLGPAFLRIASQVLRLSK